MPNDRELFYDSASIPDDVNIKAKNSFYTFYTMLRIRNISGSRVPQFLNICIDTSS